MMVKGEGDRARPPSAAAASCYVFFPRLSWFLVLRLSSTMRSSSTSGRRAIVHFSIVPNKEGARLGAGENGRLVASRTPKCTSGQKGGLHDPANAKKGYAQLKGYR